MISRPITRRTLNSALVSTLVSGTLAHAATEKPRSSASVTLAAIEHDHNNGVLALFPLEATENVGDPNYDAAFEIDISPAHRDRQRALYTETLDRLRDVDRAALAHDEQVTFDLLDWDATDRLSLMAVPRHLVPVNHMDSVPVRLAQWASGNGSQRMRTVADYQHFLERLKRLPAWTAQAVENMQEGIRRGIVLPRQISERTLALLSGLVPPDLLRSPYLAGVQSFPAEIGQADRNQLRDDYVTIVRESLTPALARLRDFWRETYLPASRGSAGLGALDGGRRWYELLVRSSTTTDLSPEQIHEIGLREVARIRTELERVKTRFGFRGDLASFFRSLAARPELAPFHTDDDVLAAFRTINEKVKRGLPRLFERVPAAALEIRAVEAMRRNTASSYYVPPAADGSRPGVFFAAFGSAAEMQTPPMTAMFLHEGQPGHHFQAALQQEVAKTPYRRSVWYDAFGEGWALYAEGLGTDLGLYEAKEAWLGRLQLEMLRALRLVIDTGLHAKGWTRDRAIAYSRDNDGSSEDDARRAVERYMAVPGQALSYKIGELKILELRRRAQIAMGRAFDIRAFHAQVLADGCVPLKLLEQRFPLPAKATS